MVDLAGIIQFLSSTTLGNLLLALIVLTPPSSLVYKRIFKSPKIEMSLDSVVSTKDVREIQKSSLSFPPHPLLAEVLGHGGDVKTQALRVTAKRATIHHCKARLSGNGHPAGYLLWLTEEKPGGSARTDLIPEEDDLLILWKAVKTGEKEELILNTEEQVSYDIHRWKDKPFDIEITFLSEEGVLNKKPYCLSLNLNSWDKLGAIETRK